MCNLYAMTKGQQAIRDLAQAMRDTTGNLPPLPGIFPDYPAPIVRNALTACVSSPWSAGQCRRRRRRSSRLRRSSSVGVASRDIRPGRTRPKHPENTVQDPPIIDPRHAARPVGKMRFDRRPFQIAEFVASHRQAPLSELESRNRRRWNRPDGLMGLRLSFI